MLQDRPHCKERASTITSSVATSGSVGDPGGGFFVFDGVMVLAAGSVLPHRQDVYHKFGLVGKGELISASSRKRPKCVDTILLAAIPQRCKRLVGLPA